MRRHIVIREEFGWLIRGGDLETGDRVSVEPGAWDSIRRLAAAAPAGSEWLQPVIYQNRDAFRTRNFVGVLQTADGLCVEILPKTTADDEWSIRSARRTVLHMLSRVSGIAWTEAGDASLATFRRPLFEHLVRRFLDAVATVVKRGIRSDYTRRREHAVFLRGRLLVSRQMRESPARHDRFWVEYDEYLPDRPENRLIRSALQRVTNWVREADNQRIVRELQFAFADIPTSRNVHDDLARWSVGRDMIHYRALRPWCELILKENTPVAFSGSWDGISLLIPMESLFERYVEWCLRRQIGRRLMLTREPGEHYLAIHEGVSRFQLRPDFIIEKDGATLGVLDAKWKLLDEQAPERVYDLLQQDFYQLYAYGRKYLDGRGPLFLVYPAHKGFRRPLAPFMLEPDMPLYVVPCDLQKGEIQFPPGIDVGAALL